ncbi:flagellar biosynthesis protein FlhB [Anoxybacter fermentans]|uniref:Flagellar biosynthetic protein FlhB n=1 Tax=Anoxybacter fermentans TaxID=1323375 RepID=A0A3Q9HRC3_9FIRM|nr:flagellar biosynthesis protein FlhB [Anoxybacter fermentans]AZR73861.1 flagellar biosynthesis protein FlhB [Anoxybacter fermentans]
MAQEKTEKATPRRRKKARKEGQVAKSKELTDAITLFGGIFLIQFMIEIVFLNLKVMMRGALTFDYRSLVNTENIITLLIHYLVLNLKLVAPFLVGTALLGGVATFLQVGPFFSVEILKPKLNRINPVKGFKNLFSLRSLVELLKALFKIFVISLTAYLILKNEWKILWDCSLMDLEQAVRIIGSLIFKLGLAISIVMIVLGIADFIYQKYEFEKSIRMSKQEIKQEFKEMEGDPLIVSKRKERMRQMAMNRMIQAVPEADVVITNPTHIAVALKYDIETMEAPVVLAMGEGKIAEKIREIAKEHKVEIVENKPLARALYETAEVGKPIPVELYQAVAEVLAFVYRLQKRKI